ncbi:11883_t:CDS:2 [Ambispora leptoticha]|uniref:11883_t:CDS:1 n=1 Tax=Ambispora leptoticha TaxID=144679 RepID=A0A9N9BXK2_9GLOM|nr:11883_t:CDS:2 [Ambispora leptoticha]
MNFTLNLDHICSFCQCTKVNEFGHEYSLLQNSRELEAHRGHCEVMGRVASFERPSTVYLIWS